MRRRALLAAAALALALSACSTEPPAALNGTYVGDLYSGGLYLGSHAMEVSTSGGTFSGDYCFVGADGSSACNFVNGTVAGPRSDGSVRFDVGGVTFHATSIGNRHLDGRYQHTEGSGTFDMERDASAQSASKLVASRADRDDRPPGRTARVTTAFADEVGAVSAP